LTAGRLTEDASHFDVCEGEVKVMAADPNQIIAQFVAAAEHATSARQADAAEA
jgi:hypothetical protein